jgi:hypothetical protein
MKEITVEFLIGNEFVELWIMEYVDFLIKIVAAFPDVKQVSWNQDVDQDHL